MSVALKGEATAGFLQVYPGAGCLLRGGPRGAGKLVSASCFCTMRGAGSMWVPFRMGLNPCLKIEFSPLPFSSISPIF